MNTPKLAVQLEQEGDGRWITEVLGIPGALACRSTRAEALGRAQANALYALAEHREHGGSLAELRGVFDAA